MSRWRRARGAHPGELGASSHLVHPCIRAARNVSDVGKVADDSVRDRRSQQRTRRQRGVVNMKLVATEMLTLDGVYQGPGGPDEDRRNGFERGGWTAAHADEEMGPFLTAMFDRADALLLGRRTWEIWEPYWPQHDDNPFGHAINTLPKYVPSTTLRDPTLAQHPRHRRRRRGGGARAQGQARRGAAGPRQRPAAPMAARARPRRRADPAALPRRGGRWPPALRGARH